MRFRPSGGLITHAQFPPEIRVETWVEPGTEVTSYYDPMVAKLIARGDDRAQAIDHDPPGPLLPASAENQLPLRAIDGTDREPAVHRHRVRLIAERFEVADRDGKAQVFGNG